MEADNQTGIRNTRVRPQSRLQKVEKMYLPMVKTRDRVIFSSQETGSCQEAHAVTVQPSAGNAKTLSEGAQGPATAMETWAMASSSILAAQAGQV